MPDDCEGVEIVDGSHKIDIVLNPTDEHMANCNGDTIPADAPLRQGDDDRDAHIKTVLWRSGTLASWPAIDLNVLIQQTITRCTNTLNGKQKIKTTVRKQTESVDSSNSVIIYPRFDTLLSNSKEIIL